MPISKSRKGKKKLHSTMSAAKKRAKKTGGKVTSLPSRGSRAASVRKSNRRRG